MKRITAYIPNTITLLNLTCGVVAIVMAFNLNATLGAGLSGMQWAFIFIGAAAVFDFLDGAMARALHAYSDLGKQLDSLSDLVSFGVAPAMLLFNAIATNPEANQYAAWAALFIPAMGALRLARFNIDERQATSFIGLPIPANALLWIGFVDWMRIHGYPGSVAAVMIIVLGALLMVSNIPMFSLKFKNFSFRENFKRYALIAITILFIVTDGIPGLAWTVITYVAISWLLSKRSPSAGL